MTTPVEPSIGRGVLHLFFRTSSGIDRTALTQAVKAAVADDVQVVPVAILGHKADFALMAVGPELWRLRRFQSDVVAAGATLVDSYVSLTETSEYYLKMPEQMQKDRLYPTVPPEGMTSWCFYPMSKTRDVGANWYALGYDERKQLMVGHGSIGRTYHGRVQQLITGSTGLDDYEWAVTLFAADPVDLKAVVYEMRFDPASSHYGIFGPFFTGMVASLDEVLTAAGVA